MVILVVILAAYCTGNKLVLRVAYNLKAGYLQQVGKQQSKTTHTDLRRVFLVVQIYIDISTINCYSYSILAIFQVFLTISACQIHVSELTCL